MDKQLTIRGVSPAIARKLERLSRDRGRSVNATVLELLGQALGEQPRRRRLARYATWTAEQAAEVDRAVSAQRVVDEKLWR